MNYILLGLIVVLVGSQYAFSEQFETVSFIKASGSKVIILTCDYSENECEFKKTIDLKTPPKENGNGGFSSLHIRIEKGTKLTVLDE